MKYAKLIENQLEFAPRTVMIDNTYYNPTPLSWLQTNGWKLVQYNKQPDYEEGWYYEEKWEETKTELVQKWIKRKEIEPEITEQEELNAIVEYNVMMGFLKNPKEV